jgi:trehalose-phosphatase
MAALPLFHDWRTVSRRIAGSSKLAVFTDFDGTLVPFQKRAEDAHLSPHVRGLLSGIVERGHVMGFVSGRRLRDLERRVNVRGAWYVGVHGFFVRAPDHRTWARLRPGASEAVARITRRLRRTLSDVPGVMVEAKRASVAVHYARVGGTAHDAADSAVRTAIRHQHGVRIQLGRRVIEILPDGSVDKATAIKAILHREWPRSGAGPRGKRLAIFLGDDLTDERVFESWPGLSIVVGPRRPSAARYALESPADVRTFFERLTRIC